MGEDEGRRFRGDGDVEAFLDSPEFAEGFMEYLAEKLCEMPGETLVAIVRALDLMAADARAPEFARRYRAEGVRITFAEAVEVARGLMFLRTPYRRESGEKRPADALPYIYDYEILAAKARRDGSLLKELVERSNTEKLAWYALQVCVKSKLRAQETVEGELLEWALEVAAGTRTRPSHRGRDQTAEMRDALILETVEALVACGLTKTRNDASEPRSACDAVAAVLGMTYDAVRKASERAACGTKVGEFFPTTS